MSEQQLYFSYSRIRRAQRNSCTHTHTHECQISFSATVSFFIPLEKKYQQQPTFEFGYFWFTANDNGIILILNVHTSIYAVSWSFFDIFFLYIQLRASNFLCPTKRFIVILHNVYMYVLEHSLTSIVSNSASPVRSAQCDQHKTSRQQLYFSHSYIYMNHSISLFYPFNFQFWNILWILKLLRNFIVKTKMMLHLNDRRNSAWIYI